MRTLLLSLPLIALAGFLAAPEAGAAEAAVERRPATSQLADRDDDGRAARSRPGGGRVDDRRGHDGRVEDRSRSGRDDGWERRDDRRGGRDHDRGRHLGHSRGGTRDGGFPFLGGGRGLVLYELPRHSDVDARDLSRILGRNAYRRLEDETRRAGLRGPLHGVLSSRGHALRLDVAAGNVFVGRLIDRNGDWIIDEGRASEQFHSGHWRRR
jgi:hypothetical protein